MIHHKFHKRSKYLMVWYRKQEISLNFYFLDMNGTFIWHFQFQKNECQTKFLSNEINGYYWREFALSRIFLLFFYALQAILMRIHPYQATFFYQIKLEIYLQKYSILHRSYPRVFLGELFLLIIEVMVKMVMMVIIRVIIVAALVKLRDVVLFKLR